MMTSVCYSVASSSMQYLHYPRSSDAVLSPGARPYPRCSAGSYLSTVYDPVLSRVPSMPVAVPPTNSVHPMAVGDLRKLDQAAPNAAVQPPSYEAHGPALYVHDRVHADHFGGSVPSSMFTRWPIEATNNLRSGARSSQSVMPDPAASPRQRNFMAPEKYDVKSCLVDYLEHFEEVGKWNNWNFVERAMQLAMNLTGSAKKAYKLMKMEERRNYFVIISCLRKKFGEINAELVSQEKFWSRKIGTNEELIDFAQDQIGRAHV